MDILPVKVLLLGAIPEAILILWAGLSLLGVRTSWKKIILAGILQGLTAYFIRRYMDFGVHTVAQFITIVTYMCILIGVNLPTALIAALISYAVVIITEGCIYIFFDLNIAYIMSDEWLRLLFFIPHNSILAVIGYLCRKKNISLQQEFTFLSKIVK
ncbi:hypothetical protein HNQ80_003732 [Anaerosolibacter carboniphilus]|uniref:Uncharacterized protein n=1 Tax=Anaerosolibacter carboniphilus TaxID=1417629 RepID=A0A841L5B5_9FIRM|nr:hypothetical protein [Anaerosolibacter carboniphilus]MBB6217609.1 hypothetical protein [Anaerosolibacter carboniphilus]